jgi:nucleoside-diphosphate-sugar epimerase
MCAKFMAKERPATTTDGQRYDYVYVDDAVRAVHGVAIDGQAIGFFDLDAGRGVTVREVIERVRDLIDPALPVGFGEASLRGRPGHAHGSHHRKAEEDSRLAAANRSGYRSSKRFGLGRPEAE